MDYFKQLFARAWADTWETVVGSPILSLIIPASVFAVTLVFYRHRRGPEAVKDEILAVVVSLGATCIVFVCIFLYNALVLTPKRILAEERKARQKADAAAVEAEAIKAQREETEAKARDLQEQLTSSQIERLSLQAALDAKPQAKIEGATVSVSQIASPFPESPFAMEVVIQVQSDVSPFGFKVTCDKPVRGLHRVVGAGNVMSRGFGDPFKENETYMAFVDSPPITSKTPLQITIFSKHPFRIQLVQRVN